MASVLLTGSSRGIGKATALVLGRAGHTIYATMRHPSASPDLAQAAEREGLPIHIVQMDVDSDDSVAHAVDSIIGTYGPPDVLINNAGIERRGVTEELDISHYRAVMETNYFGPLRCTQALLPWMRERRSGCIINVSSVAGRVSSSPLGSYAASKFALEAFSEALAQEVKMFNIRVAIVQPGIIDTSMAQRIAAHPPNSAYPHIRRMACLFNASLQNAASPVVVGQTVCEIIERDTWKLRHPTGSDAEHFLQWRASMSDEEWVDWGAAPDEIWYQSVQRDFGINAHMGA